MSWRPTYRSSKFRNVYGKVANREHCYDGVPITKNVHDNHFCAVNSKFLAVVTESAGGGSFIVIPVSQVRYYYSTTSLEGLHGQVPFWTFKLLYLLHVLISLPLIFYFLQYDFTKQTSHSKRWPPGTRLRHVHIITVVSIDTSFPKYKQSMLRVCNNEEQDIAPDMRKYLVTSVP